MRAILIFLVVLVLSGCAAETGRVADTRDFPSVRKSFDVTFGWKTSATGEGVQVEGYALNHRYPRVEELELDLSLRDGSGKERASKTFFFIPSRLEEGESAPFSVTLPVRPEPGDRFRFLYRYVETDDRAGSRWMDSFEVPAVE